jgi:hypothetical protein
MQRTNLKDEECFDPEFWKENVYLSSSWSFFMTVLVSP